MKIYRKSAKIFFVLTIIFLIIALLCFYKEFNSIANFLLGLVASTSVIVLQSEISYKIEISKNIMPHIKKIDEIINHLSHRYSLSRFVFYNYYEEIIDVRNNIDDLFYNLNILKDMDSIKKKIKIDINLLYDDVLKLVDETYLIFKYFDEVDNVKKGYLYIELVKTLSSFDFKSLREYCFSLARKIDFNEYISRSSFEDSKVFLQKKVIENPKELYINRIISKNKIEYETYEKEFERQENFKKYLEDNIEKYLINNKEK